MSNFTKPLDVRYLSTERKWLTLRKFSFYIGVSELMAKDIITVPKHTKTDFASVPPVARWVIPKSGRYNQAAVLHDFEYTEMIRPKVEVDKRFLEAMKILKVPLWKRHTMYRAVRMNFIKAKKWGRRAKRRAL